MSDKKGVATTKSQTRQVTQPDIIELPAYKKQFIARNNRKDEWELITDLLDEPWHETYAMAPVNKELITDAWKEANPNPSTRDYFALELQKFFDDGKKLPDHNLDKLCKKYSNLEMIPADKLYNKREVEQRDHRQYCKSQVFDIALNFNFVRAMWKVVRIKGDDRLKVVDGGGTTLALLLRGFKEVPCLVWEVDSEEEFEALFTDINSKRIAISDYDKWISAVYKDEQWAQFIDRVLQDASSFDNEISMDKNHPHSHYRIELSPMKSIFTWEVFKFDKKSGLHQPFETVAGDQIIDYKKSKIATVNEFSDWKGEYIKRTLQIMKEVWPGSKSVTNKETLNAAVFKTLLAGFGALNGHISDTLLVALLKKLQNEEFDSKVSNSSISQSPNKDIKHLDASTSNMFARSLTIGGFAPNDYQYAVVFCKLWNELIIAGKEPTKELLPEEYIDNMITNQMIIRFDPNKNYKEDRYA